MGKVQLIKTYKTNKPENNIVKKICKNKNSPGNKTKQFNSPKTRNILKKKTGNYSNNKRLAMSKQNSESLDPEFVDSLEIRK